MIISSAFSCLIHVSIFSSQTTVYTKFKDLWNITVSISIVKLFMVEYFYTVLHFSTSPKNNIYFKKFQISEKNRCYKILISASLLWIFFQVPYVSQFPASVKTREKVVRQERYREENRVMKMQFKMQTNLPFLLDSL